MPPSDMKYIAAYLSARELFGVQPDASFIRERIGTYGWKPSLLRLSQLSSFLALNETTDEQVRQRTIDPLFLLTGDQRTTQMFARMRAIVAHHRSTLRIVHDEVLSHLQHLVLVDGNESDETPSDQELSLWMLMVNSHLGEWASPNQRELTVDEKLIAAIVRGRAFNRRPHWMALAVRCYELFRACPEDASLGGDDAWARMQLETFGVPFEQYFSMILMVLLSTSISSARGPNGEESIPAVGPESWAGLCPDLDWVKQRLDALAISRAAARDEILAAPNAVESSGFLHAPALLRRKPLIVDVDSYLITSPSNVAVQFHAGPWGAYLQRAKEVHGDSRGFLRWSSAFGEAVERYCASFARYARDAGRFRSSWRMILPENPGDADEIEDVILVEDDQAVLFSVKSSMLPERDVHRATSEQAVIDWLDRYLFAETRSFKGAVRKLDKNISEVLAGDFERLGLSRNVKILPVLVGYDELGEDVFLYQRIRRRCQELGLLQQPGVAPLTLASIDWYESMMEYVAAGRSLVGLLRKRKRDKPWFDRRLDQQLFDVHPPIKNTRLPQQFQAIYGEVMARLRRSET